MTLKEVIKAKTARKKLVAVMPNQYPTKTRLVVVGALLVLWTIIIAARLVRYQVNEHTALNERAEQQQQRVVETSPRRGTIIDRNGRELARSIEVSSLYITPTQVLNPKHDADH